MVRVEHLPGGGCLGGADRRAGGGPGEVRVVIETRHGLLVEALVAAGYTVLPVNPQLVSRRRGPARKNRRDARVLLALDRHAGLGG